VVDCSGLKQQLAFRVMEAAGTLGSRSGFARVRVGGVDYGIYDAIEVQDDRLLADRFEDGSGNLYDGAYIWYGGSNYTLMDFTEAVEDQWELEEGVDVGRADIIAVREALDAGTTNDAFVETMRTVWDMDAFFRYAAVEHWVGQNDGYILNTNNNRVYFDPTDGRGTFISYDLDYSFMPQPWGHNWNNPRGRMAWHCVNDPECRAGIADAAAELLTTLEATPLLEEFDAWDEMTRLPAINDRNNACSTSQIGNKRGVLRDWIVGRGDMLRDHWGLP
jgi:spore coat protein CotH